MDAKQPLAPDWSFEIFKAEAGFSMDVRRWQALNAADKLEAQGFEVVVSQFDEETVLVGHRKSKT